MNKVKDIDEESIYGKFEMKYLMQTRETKNKLLLPILKVLDKLKIKSDHVSYVSAFSAICALTLTIYFNQPIIFAIGIWLHMLLDGIDGALARFQKNNSIRGTYIDVICDQVGITTALIFVLYFNIANPINITVFYIFYAIVLIISIYLLYRKSRYEIVYRPRIFFYYALTIDALIFIRFTEIVVFISNILLFVAIILGFYQIKLLNKKS